MVFSTPPSQVLLTAKPGVWGTADALVSTGIRKILLDYNVFILDLGARFVSTEPNRA